MSQLRTHSVIEVLVTTAASYLTAVLLGHFFVYEMFGYELELLDNLGLTAIFVGTSMFIKFGIRRWFNWMDVRRQKDEDLHV